MLLFVYWEPLLAYVRDQHYQEHFVYLWLFLAAALWRSLKAPFRARFGVSTARDWIGITASAAGVLLVWFSSVAGSSTGLRTSLVAFLVGCAVLAVPRWTVKRCLLHGLLLLLCFGLPHALYYPITSQLQWGVVALVEVPVRLGLAGYRVEAATVVFPHYNLEITADCSGLGQLVTFLGIAALGVLSSAQRRSRTLFVFGLAVVLAWLSNLARVALFVGLVALGWTGSVESSFWHAALGCLVFAPFVLVLIGVILRTHVPLPAAHTQPLVPGRVPVAGLLLPLLAVHLVFGRPEDTSFAAPAHFAGLATPPGHKLQMRAPSEADEKSSYGTPWLLHARFVRDDEAFFDLFHYVTRSRSHLCVHKIAHCVSAPGITPRYEAPVEVGGRQWWRLALDAEDPRASAHIYFAFEVGGVRRDDSAATQLEVMRQRLLFGAWEVRLTRIMLPGPLPAQPNEYERQVLGWLGTQTATRD